MNMILSPEAVIFLWSTLLGTVLGVCYDIFRILRIAVPSGKVLIFIEDLLFFLLAAIVSFFFYQAVNQGIIRGYFLIGELLGFVLYYGTVGKIVYRCAEWIIRWIKKIFGFIFRILLFPLKQIFRLFRKPLRYLRNVFRKLWKKLKNILQLKAVMVYNYFNPKNKWKQREQQPVRKKGRIWRKLKRKGNQKISYLK